MMADHAFKIRLLAAIDRHRFTALGLPWRSPVQVLTEVDVATQLALVATALGGKPQKGTGCHTHSSIRWVGDTDTNIAQVKRLSQLRFAEFGAKPAVNFFLAGQGV